MTETVSLIVGLGNPGPKYQYTRHNAGALFLDALGRRFNVEFKPEQKFFGLLARAQVQGQDLRLLFPTTFMNNSGKAVAAISQYFKIPPASILVAYDELDFPVGTTRLKFGGGHGGHNGVRDIIKALGSPDFQRLRIGIGHPGDPAKVLDWVLGEPGKQDADVIYGDLQRAADIVPLLVKGELQKAMNQLHTLPD